MLQIYIAPFHSHAPPPCASMGQVRAQELVDAALGDRDPTSVTRVRLSNKSYSAEAAAVIGEALQKMTSVSEVYIYMIHK